MVELPTDGRKSQRPLILVLLHVWMLSLPVSFIYDLPLQRLNCSIAGECVSDVSCGRNHTACASAGGRVFCWGDNTHGQCGVGKPQLIVHPHCIPIIAHADRNLKPDPSESHDSTNKSSRDGNSSHIDGSGSDRVNQLCSLSDCCHSSRCHANQTGCTDRLVNVKIVRVSCGWTHTAVLSNTGKLWTWGTGSQLGITDGVSVPVPYPVEFPANRQVISVSCGGQHTVALTIRHETHKLDSTAVNDSTVKTGLSRTVSEGPNTTELIKLSNVPPEAKKGIARHSTSDQQKTDSDVATDNDEPVMKSVDKSVGVDIPMQRLSSSNSPEPGRDVEVTNCDAECELANTCIDDVLVEEPTDNGDFPAANAHSENCGNGAGETTSQSHTESSALNIPALTSSGASYTSSGSVPKSRSSFLDETEAIMFLEKQLSDANTGGSLTAAESKSGKERSLAKVERKDGQEVTLSMSPFAKTVESLLQHVPSSPVVQEYVSNLTKTVVSNLRTSVDRRLNYVTSQVELSMRSIASLNKVAESCETEVATALDDSALLERLALSDCVSSFRLLTELQECFLCHTVLSIQQYLLHNIHEKVMD